MNAGPLPAPAARPSARDGPFRRRAEWIWRPRALAGPGFVAGSDLAAAEANRYVYFRFVVELDERPGAAPCLASADGRYQLFVNGTLVGRGPGRCSPAAQLLDAWDLAPHLKRGRNVIAALVHAYGRHTAWYELPTFEHARAFGCGGFFLQGGIDGGGGDTHLFDTGGAWRCLEAAAWRRDAPGNSLGWMEHHDARAAPTGWKDAAFDDAGWQPAQVLRLPGRNFSGDVVPFPHMAPSPLPPMRERLSDSPQIRTLGEVRNAAGGDLAARIEAETIEPLAHCTVTREPLTIRTWDEHGVVLLCDFGGVRTGYVHLELVGPAGASVDIVHGEQLREDGRVRIFGGIDGYDAVPAHRYTLREGAQTWERFEWSGLRYLQLTFRHCTPAVRIYRVALRETGYPVAEVGAFACSDPVLERIWRAGATTLRRCMHDGYVDCPSREQRQWLDGYLQARINQVVFGDTALAAEMIRQIEQSQQPDGLTMMAAPGDFARAGAFNIPDFSLYWVMMVDDHVRFTGDLALARAMYPAVVRVLRWFERFLDADGLLADVPHWVFVDWAELDKHGQVTALNAHFVEALRAAARLAAACAHPRELARWRKLAVQVATAVNRLLWDPHRGVYVDARRGGMRGRRVSQQANAAVIAYGVAPAERWRPILDAIMDEDRLVLTRTSPRDPAACDFDETRDIVLAQPFSMHVLHRALRRAGRQPQLVANIRARWPELLADGEATLRETWQRTPTTSLCHAWSATPTLDLSTDVLGVIPLAPGFAEVQVSPVPCGLAWARGRCPSVHGPITVEWHQEDERFVLELELPAGCRAICNAPLPHRWCDVDDGGPEGGARVLAAGRHRLVARREPELARTPGVLHAT